MAVRRRHLVLFAYRLQAGVEHHVDELQAARIELGQVAAAQVERQRATVELVRADDQPARLLHVLPGLLRGQGLADGLPGEVVEVRLQRRSEAHKSELQSIMHISYAVVCCKTKKRHSPM